MPANRLPWVKVWIEAFDHEKLAALSDSEFRTWATMLAKASQQPKRWRFASVEHAALVTGRKAKDIKRLIELHLVDEVGSEVAIHDAKQWQEANSMSPAFREARFNGDGRLSEPPANGGNAVTKRWSKSDNTVVLEGEGERDKEEDVPPLVPPRGKARQVKLADDEFQQTLEDEYWQVLGSRQAVRDCIDLAMSHKARLKATDQRAYLRNWLRKEKPPQQRGRLVNMVRNGELRCTKCGGTTRFPNDAGECTACA